MKEFAFVIALVVVGQASALAQQPPVVVAYDVPKVFVLHEPVVLDFRIDNNADFAINADLGFDRTSAFSGVITKPDGTAVRIERAPREGIGRIGRLSLRPHSVFTQHLILNKWSQFDQIGQYIVDIKLTTPIMSERGVVMPPRSSIFHVDVTPNDSLALDRVCQRLAQIAVEGQDAAEFHEAAKLLAYVDDPIGIQYMQDVLRRTERVDPLIFGGLRRINTPAARAALAEAAGTGGPERASQARAILNSLQQRR
jgi:hypothetical protein